MDCLSDEDFRSAQFALLPEVAFKRLERAIPLHEAKHTIEEIFQIQDACDEDVRMLYESPNPIRACFQALCERCVQGSCRLVCTAPVEHFRSRRCAPIGKVLERIAIVVLDIEQNLVEEDVEYVLYAVECGPDGVDHSAESGYILSEMNFPQKRIVYFWPNDSLVTAQNRGTILPIWSILRENLAQNFRLTMPPPEPYTDYWKQYVLLQLEQAEAVIVAPTPALFQLYAHETSKSLSTNDPPSSDCKAAFLMDYIRGMYDYSPIINSSERLSRPLPPTVLALAGNDLDEAYEWSGFVFLLPSQIEPLMAATYNLIMAL